MLDTASTEGQQAPATTETVQTTAKPDVAAVQTPETKQEETKTAEPVSESDRQAKELAERRSQQQEALDRLRAEKAAKKGEPVPAKDAPKDAEKPEAKAEPKKDATSASGEKERNEKGQFVSKEKPEGEPEKKAEEKPEEKPATVATGKKVDPPAHWPKEAKARWEKLSDEDRQYLHEDGKRIAREFTRVTTENKQFRDLIKAFDPINEAIRSELDTIKGWGMSPDKVFKGLITTAKSLESDPVGTIKKLAEDYSVPLSSLISDADLSNLPPDPRLEGASTQIASLERQLANAQRLLEAERKERETYFARQRQTAEQREVEEIQTRAQQYRGEIDRIASELPHFEELENDIAELLPTVMKKFPNDQVGALREAHRIAMHANPTLSQSLISKQVEEAEAKRRAEAERIAGAARTAARVNVPANASANPATQDPDAIRFAALKRARDKAAERSRAI